MGGGPEHVDVVRASCILTFPECTQIEPVPVDAWFLHAVGLTFLRRLARDRLDNDMKISLLMQKRDVNGKRRYIAVNSNEILKKALEETFVDQHQVLVLHIISLDKVHGHKSIHVRPESNPNVSPEPVPPLGMIFPTLPVDGLQPSIGEELAPSLSMSQSVQAWRPKAVDAHEEDKPLAKSMSYVEDSPEQQKMVPSVHKSDAIEPQKAAAEDVEAIPLARVVGSPRSHTDAGDYVMLEVQNMQPSISGSDDTSSSSPGSRYFISTSWHLQAEEMSASMRLSQRINTNTPPPPPTGPREEERMIPEAQYMAIPLPSEDDEADSKRMEDSFVKL